MTETQDLIQAVDPVKINPLREAIIAAKSEIKRLEKADKNVFGKYDFTSVDDVKDHIRPILAKHGLDIDMDEIKFKTTIIPPAKANDKPFILAKFKYAFQIVHVSGEKGTVECRSVPIQYTGAQTSGAAQSYGLKEYFKSRFQVSTGDTEDEADQRNQDNLMGEKLSKQESKDTWTKLKKDMATVIDGRDHLALQEWWSTNRSVLMTLPGDWFNMMKNDYGAEWTRLKAEAALDGMSDADLDKIAEKQEPIQ